MTAVVTLVNVLQLLNIEYQEQMLISKLNKFFNIDHNVYLLDSSTNFNRFINVHEACTPQSIFIFNSIKDKMAGLEFRNRTSKNELLVVVPNRSLDILTRAKEIQKSNLNIKIGVFYSHIGSDVLLKIFQWAWENRIINIFVAMYPNDCNDMPDSDRKCLLNVFSYNPFGTFDVLNVTSEKFEKFFLSQKSNFQQYKLKIGMKEPSSVLSHVMTWKAIFHVMNSSYSYLDKSTPMEGILDNPKVDVYPQTYTKGKTHPNFVYPWSFNSVTIVVPEALPYSGFLQYFETIILKELFDIYFLTSTVVVLLLLTIFRYKNRRKIMFLESVADVLNLLMNDNGGIKYQQLQLAEAFLIVPLTFTGIVIVDIIMSNL